MHLPDISILGLGYLGLPLAQKCYEQGSQVAAIKRNLTSDDINLPIELDIIDLNQDDLFHSSALWQNHINKPTWFCLLPPSSLNHYADTLKKWLSEQTAFDGKKVLAAFEAPESQARAAQMEELTNKFQISGTPTVIVGGKYQVEFKDWQSGMTTIDQLVDKVREEQKKPQ